MACSATILFNVLCNCQDVNMHWCFVHNKVGTRQRMSINECDSFGFVVIVAFHCEGD